MNRDTLHEWLFETTFLTVTLANWLFAFTVMVVAFFALRIAISFLRRRLAKVAEHTDSIMGRVSAVVVGGTSNILIGLVAILIGIGLLDLPPRWMDRVSSLWFIVVVLQVALWVSRAITLGMSHYVTRSEGAAKPQLSALASLMMWGAKVFLWAIVLLAMLSNLGVNITAFVASLGVGGIAVALAVQNILGDLFASLSIAVDKPFEVGDFIVVDSQSGTVEHVGLKTTRIRSLSGEQIVMANTSMLGTTIQNFKRLQERRIVFKIGLTYDCTAEQARQVPTILREIIQSIDNTRFDRAHFQGFGDSTLDFETVYIVLNPGYSAYMDIQQEINLRLMVALEKLGVDFAFPTQTIHVASQPEPKAPAEPPPPAPATSSTPQVGSASMPPTA